MRLPTFSQGGVQGRTVSFLLLDDSQTHVGFSVQANRVKKSGMVTNSLPNLT